MLLIVIVSSPQGEREPMNMQTVIDFKDSKEINCLQRCISIKLTHKITISNVIALVMIQPENYFGQDNSSKII